MFGQKTYMLRSISSLFRQNVYFFKVWKILLFCFVDKKIIKKDEFTTAQKELKLLLEQNEITNTLIKHTFICTTINFCN